jgi:hypothetical protein
VAQATWLLMLVSPFDRQSGHKRGQAGKIAAVTSGSTLMDLIDVDVSKYMYQSTVKQHGPG